MLDREALPPLEPAMSERLADETIIAVGSGTETLANLAAGTYPYDDAVEIPATTTSDDLASEWRLLPLNSECIQNCVSGSSTHVTLGLIYKADGDKIVASYFNYQTPGDDETPATGATAITWTAQGKNDVNTALGLGGDGHEITLAYYDGEFDGTTPEYLIDSPLNRGDDIDTLIFQNQYSMLSFWLYPNPRFNIIDLGFSSTDLIGLLTPDAQIPSSGSVDYEGIAVGYVFEGEDLSDNFFVYGDSSFTADFGVGTLSGKITVSAYQTSDLRRKLGGGEFGESRGTIGIDFSGATLGSRGNFYADSELTYSPDNSAPSLGIFSAFKKEGMDEFVDNLDMAIYGDFYGPAAAEIGGELELETSDESLDLEFQFTADKQ